MTYLSKFLEEWEFENEKLWLKLQFNIFNSARALVKFFAVFASLALFLKYRSFAKLVKISSQVFRLLTVRENELWRSEHADFLSENASSRFLRF